MSDHRSWELATAAIWWLIAIWEGWHAWRPTPPSTLAALWIAVASLGIAGWKGGELVYRHGIGVQHLASTAQLDQAVFDAIFTDHICH